jgi:hypothetical protein
VVITSNVFGISGSKLFCKNWLQGKSSHNCHHTNWGRERHDKLKNGVFLDTTRCGSSKTHVSEELSTSIIRGSVCRLLFTVNVVPSSPILVTLMMEALRSSETSVLTRATQLNIQEDAIIYSHRRENLKCYTWTIAWNNFNMKVIGNACYESEYQIQ